MRWKFLALLAIISLCSFGRMWRGHGLYEFPELAYFPGMPANSPSVTKDGVELGRLLFYDPILSRDSNISCGSCHKQEYAFSDAPNRFSKVAGAPLSRNTPALFNLAWQSNFFWDGRSHSLENQALHPLREKNEMNLSWPDAVERIRKSAFYKRKFNNVFAGNEIDSNTISSAIAQFERTIISYRSKYDRVILGHDSFTRDEAEGFVLMNDMTKGDCLHCHTTDADALGSTFAFSNNGLDRISQGQTFTDAGRGLITGRQADNGKFKIPSVRNLAFTAPYMHDGRFKSIEEVLKFYSNGVQYSPTISAEMEFVHRSGAQLSSIEQKKIITFLKTLSDSALITDPAFGNPFVLQQKLR